MSLTIENLEDQVTKFGKQIEDSKWFLYEECDPTKIKMGSVDFTFEFRKDPFKLGKAFFGFPGTYSISSEAMARVDEALKIFMPVMEMLAEYCLLQVYRK